MITIIIIVMIVIVIAIVVIRLPCRLARAGHPEVHDVGVDGPSRCANASGRKDLREQGSSAVSVTQKMP